MDTGLFVAILFPFTCFVLFVVVPLLGWLALCAVSAIATATMPASALAQGLDPGQPGFTKEFDSRVKERFPVGTTVTELTEELGHQGFAPIQGVPHIVQGHEMIRHQGNVACDVMVHVGWTADQDDRVATISGWFDWVCL